MFKKTLCKRVGGPALSYTNVLYVGQKTGIAWCLKASDLTTVWSTQVAPAGTAGGLTSGSSLDTKRYYVSCVNDNQNNWVLKNGTTVKGGGWAALDKLTGKILWTTSNPANFDPSGAAGLGTSHRRSSTAFGIGPTTSVLGAVLVTSTDYARLPNYGTFNVMVPDTTGNSKLVNVGASGNAYQTGVGGSVYLLDKVTGEPISSYQTGASVYGGFSADARCVWVGSGHDSMHAGTTVFGWCVAEKDAYSIKHTPF